MKGVFEVERWKGEMVERFPRNRLYQTIYRVITGLTRDPVPWGGKVRLPQRPEVSPKQATPLPLPNRLRQPNKRQSASFFRINLREPRDP